MIGEQRTDDWFAQRLGRVTASRVSDVMAKTKSGYAASRTNYMMELLCQRLTGQREEGYVSAAMQRGTDLEPAARSVYEASTGILVQEVGFIVHPEITGMGASPDGLVMNDGLLEIKCPNTATHIDFLRTGKPDNKYQWQMLCQMECTGRDWCDFVSYDDRLPPALQYHCIRFHRDDTRITEMLGEVRRFLEELEQIVEEMTARMAA